MRKRSEKDATGIQQCNCSSGNSDYFCKQCRRVVCTFCISTKHKHHGCETVDKVSGDVQNGIREYDPEKKKKEKMVSVLQARKMIDSMKKDLVDIKTNKIDEVDERLDDLYNELKKIRSKIVRKIKKTVRKESEYLNEAERILDNTAKSITSLCDAAKQLVGEQNSVSVITDGYSICADIEEIKVEMPEKGDAFGLDFCPGTTDEVGLQAMFGKISIQPIERKWDGSEFQNLTMAGITLHSSFRVNFPVYYMTCVTDDMCWCGEWGGTDIRLMDITGGVERRRQLPGKCTGLTSRDGTVYISCNNKTIYKLSTDDTLTVVQKCLTFDPQGLTCLPGTGELLVCGGEDGVLSITDRGVQPALTDKFSNVRDITLNEDGDICVSDYGQQKVFIFNSHRRHSATYTGHADMTRTMFPRGVTCDGRGGFIVCDFHNSMLHVISRDGENVMMYDTGEDSDRGPLRLDISQSGRLWVCFGVGHICVYNTR